MDWDLREEVENRVEGFLSLPIFAEPEPIIREDRLVELVPRKRPGPNGVLKTVGARNTFLGRTVQGVS